MSSTDSDDTDTGFSKYEDTSETDTEYTAELNPTPSTSKNSDKKHKRASAVSENKAPTPGKKAKTTDETIVRR